MTLFRKRLHQSVFTVPEIQTESQPYDQRTGYRSEREAYPRTDPRHIQDDYRKKHRHESSGKDEQVL